MPELNFSAAVLIPPFPFHFLTILRYFSLVIVIIILISPQESGGLTFLLLLGITALVMVADVYGTGSLLTRFATFFVRIIAIIIPILLAGIGTQKSTRQSAVLLAILGIPALGIMLFVPFLDPSL